MTQRAPGRGEIWDVALGTTLGREQAGNRPALILSVDPFNEGPAELVVAIPMTRTNRHVRWHVGIKPPEGGLTAESFVQCEAFRSLSKSRLRRRRGRVTEATMRLIEDRLRILLGL